MIRFTRKVLLGLSHRSIDPIIVAAVIVLVGWVIVSALGFCEVPKTIDLPVHPQGSLEEQGLLALAWATEKVPGYVIDGVGVRANIKKMSFNDFESHNFKVVVLLRPRSGLLLIRPSIIVLGWDNPWVVIAQAEYHPNYALLGDWNKVVGFKIYSLDEVTMEQGFSLPIVTFLLAAGLFLTYLVAQGGLAILRRWARKQETKS